MAPNNKRSQDSINDDGDDVTSSSRAAHRRSSKPRLSKQPKNLVFNFDGTGADEFSSGDDALTNVAKLHLLFGGDFRNGEQDNKPAPSFYNDITKDQQISCYYSGIGTDHKSDIKNQLEFAFALKDVDKIINQGLNDLRKLYTRGDHVFVVGFSRGAAIARKFCSVVSQQKDLLKEVEVDLLICFDTVASFGFPDFSTDNRPLSSDLFEDKKVARNVNKALHCVSIDEQRRVFQPTLMNDEPKVTEVWFCGDHSDIGGGWQDETLSDNSLQFVLKNLKEYERRIDLRVLSPDEVKYGEINKAKDGSGKGRKVDVDPKHLSIDPNPLGTIHRDGGDGLIARLLRDDRRVVVISDDKISDKLPIIHHSVATRIRDTEYSPASLKDTRHLLLDENGVTHEMNGLEDYYMKPSKRSLQGPTNKYAFRTEVTANASVAVN